MLADGKDCAERMSSRKKRR